VTVINTNFSSLITQSALRVNNRALTETMAQLSTGKRINSAADDAAGLAISESLNTQARGVQTAMRNINDGISLLQTADSAFNTLITALQRMRELAVQASTDTYSALQRTSIDIEVRQLQESVDSIVSSTTWNDRNLLDGSISDLKIQVGAYFGDTLELNIDRFPKLINDNYQEVSPSSGNAVLNPGNGHWYELINTGVINWETAKDLADGRSEDGISAYLATITSNAEANFISASFGDPLGNAWIGASDSFGNEGDWQWVTGPEAGSSFYSGSFGNGIGIGYSNWLPGEPNNVNNEDFAAFRNITGVNGWNDYDSSGAGEVNMMLVEYTATPQQMIVTRSFSVSTVGDAKAAIGKLDALLDRALAARATIGGQIGRLSSAGDNAANSLLNISESRSQIVDTNYALATTESARTMIIQQASTAVLAQANTQPQMVLKLLQG
jgi:flagellin